MARVPQSLATGTLSVTTLETIYNASSVTSVSLVLTNDSASSNEATVYINNGDTDLVLCKYKIPAGVGKTVTPKEVATQRINGNFSVKIQLSNASAVNYFLSGSVIG
jgi:hypothetical protein